MIDDGLIVVRRCINKVNSISKADVKMRPTMMLKVKCLLIIVILMALFVSYTSTAILGKIN